MTDLIILVKHSSVYDFGSDADCILQLTIEESSSFSRNFISRAVV